MAHELSPLQSEMLQMIKWFHNFCIKKDITYYVVGGTMLGTARHQGFIPWDDDIDVGVPRKDYNRLLTLGVELEKSHGKYVLESYHNGNDDYEYPYAKLYNTSTMLIENKRKKPKRGIFIDIFPLDGIGISKEDALRNFVPIKRKLNLLASRSCAVRDGRTFMKNMAVRVVGIFPEFLVGAHKLISQIDELCEKRDFDDYEFVGNIVGNWREKEIMSRACFGKPTLYLFEDTQIYGVEDYDGYLSCLYRDWRKLPPKEKQKSEHDFIQLDLEHSYLE